MRTGVRILLIAIGATLALPASAMAVERFAAVGGSTSDASCTGVPCTIERAVEVVAANGDVVTVLPGTHPVAAPPLSVSAQIELRGQPGQPLPVITSNTAPNNASTVLLSNAGATLRRLAINRPDVSGGTGGAVNITAPATVEQVVAVTSQNNDATSGCSYINPTAGTSTIRDTICASIGPDGKGLNISPATATTLTVNLRNVTLASVNDSGILSLVQPGETLNVNATNAIVSGLGNDVNAQGAGATTVALDHSNYDAVSAFVGPVITPAGSPTNQTALPVFVNAASDFHQAAGSPTINAGVTVAGDLNRLDVDGDARFLGSATDIGADELIEAAPSDTDGDGTPDLLDSCPSEAGPGSNAGCPPSPDGDGDGVPDPSDSCPAVAGPASNNGCPLPPADTDGDGDGTPDSSDACPSQAGPASNNGCPAGGGALDTTPPETTITKGPKGEITSDSATFRFSSSEAGSSFECKLDRGKFKTCSSPRRLKTLDEGAHTFRVRATDAAGNADATAAKRSFKVAKKKRRGKD